MPIDNKYGVVTMQNGAHIPVEEPGIWFRARDVALPETLEFYRAKCAELGSPERHLTLIDQTLAQINAWQEEHGARVPTSDALLNAGGGGV